jgi:predicted neutral ceramidase superfamily lipid hydrolase
MLNGSFGITLFNITNAQSLANENLLFGSKTLIKTNRFGRPFYIVLVHALIVLTLLTFITDLNIYFGFIGLGVVTTLLLTSLSVTITHFKNAAKGKTFLAFLSTIACVALLISSWIALGNDTTTRLIYAAPIMIASILGLVMFKIKKSQQPTK